MQLTKHQQEAAEKLVARARVLLSKDGARVCVFKAPTGSGKTIMTADFLRNMSSLSLPARYAFLWISSNDLHVQSKAKLSSYLADSRYKFSLLDEVADDSFEENEIVFVNWESLVRQNSEGEFTNVLMRENENGRNLSTFIANSKGKGLEIILVIDESHHRYWSQRSQDLVQAIIAPKLTLEVSATPTIIPTPEQIEHEEAGYVSMRFEDVVADGLIKIDTIVNQAFGAYSTFEGTADEAVIDAAVGKRESLHQMYSKEKIAVNPLLLIQLPSESHDLNALDQSKLAETIQTLSKRHGITVENGKLAIWLSNRKDNLEGIENNDSRVEVLIFKQAIALGWDCPRAQILVMFRDIRTPIFEIQTVGRVMRMPEVKHYDTEDLNHAYVYTNLDRITVGGDGTSQGYFKIYRATRRKDYREIKLPSVYLSRIDFGDLTLSFRQLFAQEANKRFKITAKDSAAQAKKKADVDLELLPDELKRPIIVDAVIQNLDANAKKEIFGNENVEFAVSPDEIKRAYESFAKAASLPFAPVRSHTKIQQALYDWFDKYLGYEDVSRIEIQRIVVCSENNQTIFREVIESAKERFKDVDKKAKEAIQRRREYEWDVPETDYFNENFDSENGKRAALLSSKEASKTFVRRDRSDQEKWFEQELERSKNIEWWYKNGESAESYFAVAYLDPETGFERAFYPDYVVQFSDKAIGIYDTKTGFTRTIPETKAKSDALQAYISENKKKKLKGGLITKNERGWFIFDKPSYSPNEAEWKSFSL